MNLTGQLPVLYARLAGQPHPQPRPKGRKGQGGYVPRDHPAVAHRAAWVTVLHRYRHCFGTSNVRVGLSFHCKQWRGDGDNMEKLVLDALQDAGIIANDRQVRQCGWRWDLLAETGRAYECTELQVTQLPVAVPARQR